MYRLVYTSKAAKQVRKLDRPIRKEMKKHLEEIAVDPFGGRKKMGKLRDIYGYGFNWQGTSYRVAYTIIERDLVVLVIAVGSHEGFWEEVSRYL